MIYEVINPSDEFTIEAEDERVALVVGLLLGNGKLGLKDENGDDPGLPMFLFDTEESAKAKMDRFLEESLIKDLDKFIEEKIHEVSDCLTTLVYGSIEEREKIIEREGLDGLREWNNKERNSMNDYDSAARSLAKHLRRQYLGTDVEEEPEPVADPTRGILVG